VQVSANGPTSGGRISFFIGAITPPPTAVMSPTLSFYTLGMGNSVEGNYSFRYGFDYMTDSQFCLAMTFVINV